MVSEHVHMIDYVRKQVVFHAPEHNFRVFAYEHYVVGDFTDNEVVYAILFTQLELRLTVIGNVHLAALNFLFVLSEAQVDVVSD